MMTAKQHPDEYARMVHNLNNRMPNAEQIALIEDVRRFCINAAVAIISSCPAGRERALALTALEETTMWAVAAIARAEVTA